MPPPLGAWNPITNEGTYTTTSGIHNDTYPAISPSPSDLANRSVFITGASRGIGRAIAVSFARAGAAFIALGARGDLSATLAEVRTAVEGIGARVRTERGEGEQGKEEKRKGNEVRVLALEVDVADEGSVRAAAERIAAETEGRLDVVVNNAGVLLATGEVGEGDSQGWWKNMEVNVRGPYLVACACLPLLLKGDLKALVTVSSVGAAIVFPGHSGYQISKMAATRLMEFIAVEYGDRGIMSISIHPGNTLTDIVGNGEGMEEKMKALFTETPQLAADSLVYLTKENRPWLNGRYVNVCWDLPELTSDPKKAEIIEKDQLKLRLVV